jgi:predicted short-subunit dehydrogenase-like oxidoreductase (DUF2520 family)
VVHTSGSQPLSILHLPPGVATGVFYPLQTFSKSRTIDMATVPFCLEADNPATEMLLTAIAQRLSRTVYLVSSQERKVLHTGAVFACNFANHLWALAKRLVEKEGLEFELLHPLMQETLAKALEVNDPAQVQTGPAIRHDLRLMQTHLDYLANQPENRELYRLLSESIMKLGK